MSSSEVRIGVVGTGGFANQVHMPGYHAHPRAKIVGVCDIILERAEAAAKRFGATFVTDDYKELVSRDDIDAIDVVTPNVVHVPIALAAIKAGKHVICEKPLAMSHAEAQELIAAAKETGAKTGVNFTYRGHPASRYAQYLISRGHIGRIFHVNAFYMQGWLVSPDTPIVWRLQKDMTGTGVLGDLGSHVIDLACWFTGAKITSVVADMSTFVEERPLPGGTGKGKVDVDDASTFLARFDNGAMGTFVSSRNATARGNYQRIEVYGESGALVYSWDDKEYLEASVGHFAKEYQMLKIPVPARFTPRDGGTGFTENISNFIDAILNDKEMVPNFADGLENQEVLDAVSMSAEDGTWVSIPSN